MPADFRPCDIGYSRIGVWVADLDAALQRLARLETRPLSAPVGPPGARRICVRSPDGVFIELMEDDPLPDAVPHLNRAQCPAAVRSITLSVPDLLQSAQFFSDGLAANASNIVLHTDEHEALWGLDGARLERQVFRCGDVLLELAKYNDPVGKPRRPDYRINDQGILNIAVGARSRVDHQKLFSRAKSAGARPNSRPLQLPGAGVVYVNDPAGFSVELLWIKPGKSDRDWGFEPVPADRRPAADTRQVRCSMHLDATMHSVFTMVSEPEQLDRWLGIGRMRAAANDSQSTRGPDRTLSGAFGECIEQITDWSPPHGYRYRISAGSPLVCHQGEVSITPLPSGGCQLEWTIRFRPRLPGTGALLQWILQKKLNTALKKNLVDLINREKYAEPGK
jgi:catechol 2,3-dioxygenase-like lactoylglutathione lyase family enzyme